MPEMRREIDQQYNGELSLPLAGLASVITPRRATRPPSTRPPVVCPGQEAFDVSP
jgi:hypothetical protein